VLPAGIDLLWQGNIHRFCFSTTSPLISESLKPSTSFGCL